MIKGQEVYCIYHDGDNVWKIKQDIFVKYVELCGIKVCKLVNQKIGCFGEEFAFKYYEEAIEKINAKNSNLS